MVSLAWMFKVLFINSFINSNCFILESIPRTQYKLGIYPGQDISPSQNAMHTYIHIPRDNFRVANPSSIFWEVGRMSKPGGNPHRHRENLQNTLSKQGQNQGPWTCEAETLHHCPTMVEVLLHEILYKVSALGSIQPIMHINKKNLGYYIRFFYRYKCLMQFPFHTTLHNDTITLAKQPQVRFCWLHSAQYQIYQQLWHEHGNV